MNSMNRLACIASGVILFLVLAGCGGGGGGAGSSVPADTSGTPPTGDTYPAQIDRTEVTQTGSVFYVDPATGAIGNTGSSSSPWNTLQAVIAANKIESQEPESLPYTEGAALKAKNAGAPVQAGDTLVLRAGHHGSVDILRYFNAQHINVIAEPGATVSKLQVTAASKWRFKGLTVRPDAGNTSQYALVFLESHSWSGPTSDITIDDFNIYTVENAAVSWSTTDGTDWNTKSCNGIAAFGNNMTLRRNTLKNVNFGITVQGNYALVSGNTVENFAGDGMRGLGNDMFFEYNLVKNLYVVNDNHPDGFQSWSINDDPPRERVVLRGNTFINYTDPNQPFRGSLQGIGCFDGPYVDWIVENNVVITDHWHGISLYGARNSRIVNNTVIDPNAVSPGPPWIGFFNHKDGTPSSNCVIRNNIAHTITAGEGSVADNNYLIPSDSAYSTLFVDHQNFNLRLKAGAPAIDAGSASLAPVIDKDGHARPQGSAVDIGAYEYSP